MRQCLHCAGLLLVAAPWLASACGDAGGGANIPLVALAAPTPITVTVEGRVVGPGGAGIAGVEIIDVPGDAYLDPIPKTNTDASGSFTLPGVATDSRVWIAFELTGYVSLLQAIDTSSAPLQSLPPTTLPADAQAAALAQSFGFAALDPTRSVIRVPITVAISGTSAPDAAPELQVDLQPPPDAAIHYGDGEAISFNAVPSDSYRLRVTRAGRLCTTASHATLVAADGSIEIQSIADFWSVGPTMICP